MSLVWCRCGGQESGGASTSSGDTWALGSSCEGWSQSLPSCQDQVRSTVQYSTVQYSTVQYSTLQSLPSCQDQETGGQGAGQGAEHAGAVLPHCARAAAVR